MLQITAMKSLALTVLTSITLLAQAGSNELEARLEKAFAAGELKGLHSVLVLKDGKPMAEVHFSGDDESWGRKIGNREFDAGTLHDLRSVTKSITGLLYGIALSEGIVPEPHESLIAQFPEYQDLNKDTERRAITVEDALTMRMGTQWNENLPYTSPENSEIAMEQAPDRFRYVLDRPLVTAPGTVWNYNGGATAIIARLISRGAGKSLDQFAKDKLFDPLGIAQFEWAKGADGVPSAASGLRLNIHDLAKIGQLVLDNGRHDDKQIIPADWLAASFTPYATEINGGPFGYGYFWWLAPGNPPAFVAGFGNGGQRLSISRKLGLVFVNFAGNYNQPDAWKLPVKVSRDFLGPALRSSQKSERLKANTARQRAPQKTE